MCRLSAVLVLVLSTAMAPLQTARSQQQQGEKTPQVSATVRTEVLAFVRGTDVNHAERTERT